MIFARFSLFFPNSAFLIEKSCSKCQQQKNKVRSGNSLRGRVVGGSVGASSFGRFLSGFEWFLLVEGYFRWFQVVFYFSS